MPFANVPAPLRMSPMHDRRIETAARHQSEPPPVELPHIEPSPRATRDQLGNLHTRRLNAKVLRQQVFGSQRQRRDRQPRIPIDHITDRPVATRCHHANELLARDRISQLRLHPLAIRKHPRPNPSTFQFADQFQQHAATSPSARSRIPLNRHPRPLHGSISNRSVSRRSSECSPSRFRCTAVRPAARADSTSFTKSSPTISTSFRSHSADATTAS